MIKLEIHEFRDSDSLQQHVTQVYVVGEWNFVGYPRVLNLHYNVYKIVLILNLKKLVKFYLQNVTDHGIEK